jgi:hypothetical protein
MKKSIKIIQKQAERLKHSYRKRDACNIVFDKMDNNEWSLPSELDDVPGIRKTVSPDPAAALQTAVKVIGSEKPHPKVTPPGPNQDDRDTANKIERGLSWELKSATNRSLTDIVPDIIRSAVKYGEVCVYVDYLPWRIKRGDFDEDVGDDLLSDGQFALIVQNPTTVYPKYSALGLEAVLSVQTMYASEVIDYYGENANEFAKWANEQDDDVAVSVWDWTDKNQRDVWIKPKHGGEANFTLVDEERKMKFIPWAHGVTGTSLESSPEKQRKGFLDIIQSANLWEDMNLMGTILNSEVLSYAAAPRGVVKGPNGEQVAVDYGEMGRKIVLKPGQEYEPIDPPQIDRALAEIFDRTKAKLEGATSVQVLQNLNFPAGTAFATINAVLQTAIASLQPYKTLAERVIAKAFKIMLKWIDYANGEILAYGTGKGDSGKQYSITKSDFSVRALYIEVFLNASAPTDFLQRINAATLLWQLGMPKARIFEDLNISDPEQAIIERYLEDLTDNEMRMINERRMAELQQQMMTESQQQMMVDQSFQDQNMMQNPPPSPGFENVEGQGFNPNMMGGSPAESAPSLTRELVQGMTRSGEGIAEI